jgi:hypothetical protein
MIPKAVADEIGTKPGEENDQVQALLKNGSPDRSGYVDQRSFLPPNFERVRRIAHIFTFLMRLAPFTFLSPPFSFNFQAFSLEP